MVVEVVIVVVVVVVVVIAVVVVVVVVVMTVVVVTVVIMIVVDYLRSLKRTTKIGRKSHRDRVPLPSFFTLQIL